MALRPLRQPPLLLNRRRLVQRGILAADVAAKELELAAGARALEDLWRRARECGDAARVGEDLVQGRGVAAELLLVGQRGRVYLFAGRGRGCGGRGAGRGRVGADGGFAVHGCLFPCVYVAGVVLDVFAVRGHHLRAQALEVGA